MRIRRNTLRETALHLGGLLLLALIAHPAEVSAQSAAKAPEVVIYASDLPSKALSEFRSQKEAGAAGGVLVVTPQHGGDLDPPPENDPHVTLTAKVQPNVPYRLWVRMKVGAPKGISKANLIFAQFSDAVDASGKETLRPRSASFLSLRGPAKPGWVWVGHDAAKPRDAMPLVRFKTSDVTIRLQAGAEGVAFDQVVLSPARYLEAAPSGAVVAR